MGARHGLVFGLVLLPTFASAAELELREDTRTGWNEYIRGVEVGTQQRAGGAERFLWSEDGPERIAKVRGGEILIAPVGENPRHVPSGLIHHWISATFWKGVTIQDVLAVVRDYDHYKDVYKPGIIESKLLSAGESLDRYEVVLKNRSYFSKSAIDSDYESSFVRLSPTRCYSVTRATRVQEIDHFGQPDQFKLPVDRGHGYVWRAYSLTRYEERDGGLYIEVEMIALSREIPFGLRWAAGPVIRRVAKDCMTTSFTDTRKAVDRVVASRSIKNHGLVTVAENPVLQVPQNRP